MAISGSITMKTDSLEEFKALVAQAEANESYFNIVTDEKTLTISLDFAN
ncbi:MAG: hypothetical protein PHW24_03175 [Candidatus Moranbacteria bacterium]|nr:hypothetical protein [Candidatus Moranbacteria bacterium]